jgi:peptidoglycan/LPS O-acetylase OafA/YrhL
MIVIQEWMSNYSFCFVLSGELAVDVFFWLTAFLACYFLLNRMHDNEGNMGSALKIILNRYMRLFPLYFFTLIFFWQFIVLFGGDGPMFFMYD